MKLYIFQTVPLPIIRGFSLYTQQWNMSYRFMDNFDQDQDETSSLPVVAATAVAAAYPDLARNMSTNLYDIYHCCV